MNYSNLTLESPISSQSPQTAQSPASANSDVRPSSFDEYVGQSQAINILRILTGSAAREHRPVGHLLFAGAPGLGKTSLARIVADTMGGRLVEMIGGNLTNSEQITSHLLHLERGDILFIDEIHALPRSVEEVLYPAMEDGVIPVVEQGWNDVLSAIGMQNPGKPKHRMATLPPFTMIGATTSPGLLSQPLRDRFAHCLQLEAYSIDELALIVTRASVRIGFSIPHDIALEIARRSRGTARIAISHLTWIREYSNALGVHTITASDVHSAMIMKGVDDHGLTSVDRRYLQILIDSDTPMGIGTIATALNESKETVLESIEPYLVRSDLVRRTPRGRIALPRAYEIIREEAIR